MRYDYRCQKCDNVWEERHGMNEKPTIKCPQCKSPKTYIYINTPPISYIRGNGYLDKEGRQRDMNIYKLANSDPYGKYREPGEKDSLMHSLRKKGKHQANPKTHWMGTNKKSSKRKSR